MVLVEHGTSLSVWLDFIQLETGRGAAAQARNLYKRGTSCLNTAEDVQAFASSWLDFEDLCGTLDDRQAAETRVEQRLRDVQRKRKRATVRPVDQLAPVAEKPANGAGAAAKRARGHDRPAEPEDEAHDIYQYLEFSVTKEDLEERLGEVQGLKEVRLLRRSDGASKGFAYADFETKQGVQDAVKLHLQHLKGRKMYIYPSKPPAVPQGLRRRGGRGSDHRDRGGHRGRGGRGGHAPAPSAHPSMRMKMTPMVPRAVAASRNKDHGSAPMETNENPQGADEPRKPKSQEDFRSMLK
eukprot:CAMPEP_0198370442 /NCGR_PEP_ID=MMETSP1450-20131203/156718_1 /TAXON_ID=753684 ORGANISM="Madagascaria erythrocladiodes, Strain CCMP3234" /NCGR_SAMPLE_ID=MMETSP1450 /ASSEMBLY_ACC=CAM_ASM_001115 /LENGTH=295 /DNA_ID=CAMNT_0044077983 /DNA_START=1 /DNA_END=889 /DNA_ORIENTATION=+